MNVRTNAEAGAEVSARGSAAIHANADGITVTALTPHIGAEMPDEAGLKLVGDWIASLGSSPSASGKLPSDDELLKQLDVAPAPPARRLRLCAGGPVDNARGFVLHTTDWTGEGSLRVNESLALTASLDVLKAMGPQIQWLHSYVTEDKVYCVYLAPDENSIREHARRVGIPADRVSAVRRLINPVNL